MATLRELWFVGPRRVEVRAGSEPRSLDDGELLARAIVSGVSQGTELLLYGGEGPTPFDPSLDPEDAPTYPRRYGYAWVGEICASKAGAFAAGTRIFALLPHGDQHIVRSDQLRLLPEGLPPQRAVLAANLETAVTAIWDAEISLGDRVMIFGGGTVGLLCGLLARRAGAGRLLLVEPSERRRAAALALGFDEAVSADADSARAEADVILEASGDPACLDRAIWHARREAKIVVVSFYGERKHALALGSDFHRRRLVLKSSQVSRIPPARSARWTPERRFALVLELLADPRLDGLLEAAVPFDDAPALYESLAAAPGSSLQTLFRY